MRTQLLVLSIVSTTILGCGKEVEKNARAATQAQQNGVQNTPVEVRPGACQEPTHLQSNYIQTNYKKIDRFSDISVPTGGTYALVSFQAVGTATVAANTPSAVTLISVGEGSEKAGAVEYHQICRDLNAMPMSDFTWDTSTPSAINAKDGTIAREVFIEETVFGPSVMAEGQATPRQSEQTVRATESRACKTATKVMRGAECGESSFYQIDKNTIGILRTTEIEEDGVRIQSKIFARYALSGGGSPAPRVAAPVVPKKVNVVKTSGCKCTVSGAPRPRVIVLPKLDPPTVYATQQTPQPTQRVSTRVNTSVLVVTAPAETSKSKVSVKEVTVKKTVAGDEVTKLKFDQKDKVNSESGSEKHKADLKIVETTPQSTLKIKSSVKIKKRAR